jgi:hypothetical protein
LHKTGIHLKNGKNKYDMSSTSSVLCIDPPPHSEVGEHGSAIKEVERLREREGVAIVAVSADGRGWKDQILRQQKTLGPYLFITCFLNNMVLQ